MGSGVTVGSNLGESPPDLEEPGVGNLAGNPKSPPTLGPRVSSAPQK